MISAIENVSKFINYWWFRYLMVTELYMVEKWERVTIHIIFAIIFGLFWYFNYSVVLSLTGHLLGIPATVIGNGNLNSRQSHNTIGKS